MDGARRRFRRGWGQVRGQGRSDDVAGLPVAVDGDVVRPARGVHRDIGAQHGVDRILDAAQFALSLRAVGHGAQLCPVLAVRGAQRGVGLRESLDVFHQPQQFRPHLRDAAARFVLVLQRSPEPEQGDRRRMRVHLDRPPVRRRLRIDVQVERAGDPRSPGNLGELGPSRVGRVRAGLESSEVGVELPFGGALTGRVGDDQGSVDGYQTGLVGVRRQRGSDAGVIGRGPGVDQPPRVVDGSHAGGLALAPGQVQSDVEDTAAGGVHTGQLASSGR